MRRLVVARQSPRVDDEARHDEHVHFDVDFDVHFDDHDGRPSHDRRTDHGAADPSACGAARFDRCATSGTSIGGGGKLDTGVDQPIGGSPGQRHPPECGGQLVRGRARDQSGAPQALRLRRDLFR